MLRIAFLQLWFNPADPAVEAWYDSAVMRHFVGIDLGCEPVPDETTVQVSALSGRTSTWGGDPGHGESAFAGPGSAHHQGHDRRCGYLSSTKNREQQRDPEMHQTEKGQSSGTSA
jgi:IS5 family transposase